MSKFTEQDRIEGRIAGRDGKSGIPFVHSKAYYEGLQEGMNERRNSSGSSNSKPTSYESFSTGNSVSSSSWTREDKIDGFIFIVYWAFVIIVSLLNYGNGTGSKDIEFPLSVILGFGFGMVGFWIVRLFVAPIIDFILTMFF
ncbi:hypothetical protein [Herpetosiphon geysericola]|uniref:Uncharacterized protein n=1 Tax=Herpetosiphon geysericola TaxID=70996 RepID=A0A0P6Y4X3_9CHLR|nr:hypothetical protein [Herpetosiphon geysericola]KPL80239.1 hypothetical protein SE18_24605 [Herpetosiphon geysericola]